MAAQVYKTGTVTVTEGSRNFSGQGTAWDLSLVTGGMLFIEGVAGGWPIDEITSDTAGVFALPWPSDSAVGVEYAIYLETAQSASATEANRLLRDIVYRLYSGTWLQPDATGTLAERAQYNAEAQGFIYIQTDVTPFRIFIKESATSGDWSNSTEMVGPAGEDGEPGIDGVGDFYDIVFEAVGRPGAGEEFRAIFARAVSFPSFTGSIAKASAASTGVAAIGVKKNGVGVGSITFTDSAIGVFSGSPGFAAGDVLSLVMPDPQNSTLSGLLITLAGTRVP